MKKRTLGIILIGLALLPCLRAVHGQGIIPESLPVSQNPGSASLPVEPLPDVSISSSPEKLASKWFGVRNIFEPPRSEFSPSVKSSDPLGIPPNKQPPSDTIILSNADLVPKTTADGDSPLNATAALPVIPTEPRIRLPRLTGILFSSDEDRSALLDGKFVREGDQIMDFKVYKIRKNSVLLKRNKEEHALYVQP